MRIVLSFASLLLATSGAAQSPDADGHREKARKLAERSGFSIAYELQCRNGNAMPAALFQAGAPPATRLFDNLYYVGLNSVGAYVVKTSSGLILIDTLNNSEDAQKVIVAGMENLGLDPKDLKYILISHGHGDHYGGAKWLADTYKARVLASEADWNLMSQPRTPPPGGASDRPAPNWGSAPTRDMVATDGQELRLGDTTITIALTPGHTPGTLSFVLPVFDNGKRHVLAMWGGTAIPTAEDARRQYVESAERFAILTRKLGVDVELSNHPFVDDSLRRMEQLRSRPKERSPFVIGKQRYEAYEGILKNCALAAAP